MRMPHLYSLLGSIPFSLGVEDAALLLELLDSLGVAHANDCVASHQRLQLLLGPVLGASWAQGDFDEPEWAILDQPCLAQSDDSCMCTCRYNMRPLFA